MSLQNMSKDGLKKINKFTSNSLEDTLIFGKDISKSLPDRGIIFLKGDLGSGKTTLAKSIINALTKTPFYLITSPTFTYVHTYNGPKTIHHFDCYRIKTSAEFIELGLSDYLDSLCLIEWPENINRLISQPHLTITLRYKASGKREITYE